VNWRRLCQTDGCSSCQWRRPWHHRIPLKFKGPGEN